MGRPGDPQAAGSRTQRHIFMGNSHPKAIAGPFTAKAALMESLFQIPTTPPPGINGLALGAFVKSGHGSPRWPAGFRLAGVLFMRFLLSITLQGGVQMGGAQEPGVKRDADVA